MAESDECILIVDPDGATVDRLREAFEDDGYLVHAADDGLDAICKLAAMESLPVAIVTALEMRHMSGRELVELVRTDPDLHSVVVIVMADPGAHTDLDAVVVERPVVYEAVRRLVRQLRDTVPPPSSNASVIGGQRSAVTVDG